MKHSIKLKLDIIQSLVILLLSQIQTQIEMEWMNECNETVRSLNWVNYEWSLPFHLPAAGPQARLQKQVSTLQLYDGSLIVPFIHSYMYVLHPQWVSLHGIYAKSDLSIFTFPMGNQFKCIFRFISIPFASAFGNHSVVIVYCDVSQMSL